jgi:superfamily II DNA or RNA helicase
MITLEYLNPVWSKVNKEGISLLKETLSYPYTFWRSGPHHMINKPARRPLIGKDGLFLTGFLPRVFEFLKKKGVQYQLEDSLEDRTSLIPHPNENHSFILRPEQEEAVETALSTKRGVIHYPTGSGKTVIFLSIMESFPEENILILIYRDKTLLEQTYERAAKLFPGEVGVIGYGEMNPNRITLTNFQTFCKFPYTEFHKSIDILILDECHHANDFKGEYFNIVTKIQAPRRLGFTATLPNDEGGKMALEGLIGPVIAKKRIQEVESLAKPIIKIRKLPYHESARQLSWKKVYKTEVVENKEWHQMVATDARKLNLQGRSVLILVTQIEHGNWLLMTIRERFPNLRAVFIWGQTPGEDRIKIKKMLENKTIDVVIANAVWREGVDIPSIGAIINAAQGKSEIMTMQSLGRGLRATAEKKDVVLIDYFNPSNHFLIEHFGQRLCLYMDEGWL